MNLKEFAEFRRDMNQKVLASDHLGIKRFWALDSKPHLEALGPRTMSLIGLGTSLVLRCDDCVTYGLISLIRQGVTDKELHDVLNHALIVGGSITIPHVRRAFNTIDLIREHMKTDPELKQLE